VIRFEVNNKELKAGRIVDLIVFEKFENELIQNLLVYCQNKVDFIDFFCTGDFYNKTLDQNNFFNNKLKKLKIPVVFNPLDLERKEDMNLIFKCNDKSITNDSILNNVNNWFIVKGDSDQDRAY